MLNQAHRQAFQISPAKYESTLLLIFKIYHWKTIIALIKAMLKKNCTSKESHNDKAQIRKTNNKSLLCLA